MVLFALVEIIYLHFTQPQVNLLQSTQTSKVVWVDCGAAPPDGPQCGDPV
jgi:hypothetical protein